MSHLSISLRFFFKHSVQSGECISNDPVVAGEALYKPWSGPFGSARPIRGIHYRWGFLYIIFKKYASFLLIRTLICKIEPEWEKSVLKFEREHVETYEQSNETYDTCPVTWQPTRALTASVSHQITLQQPQNVPG